MLVCGVHMRVFEHVDEGKKETVASTCESSSMWTFASIAVDRIFIWMDNFREK